jgi:tRNA threonylcarbamoyladenosine biosynthesis protein TsaB
MIWLAVDTATRSLSVAVWTPDAAPVELTVESVPTHAARLMPAIAEVMAKAGVGWPDVDALAVTVGPGSFTGLRIGISTVKGLALATGRPVVGVGALEVLARQALPWSGDIRPMLDARRGEVYTGTYRLGENGLGARDQPRVVAPDAALDGVRPETLFIGDGAELHGELIRGRFPEGVRIAAHDRGVLRAATVAVIAAERFRGAGGLDPEALAPLYLRRADAREPAPPLARVP